MNIQLSIPQAATDKILSLMENFPEASQILQCTLWRHEDMKFIFQDHEDCKTYKLDRTKLEAAIPLLYSDKWPKGCTPPPVVFNEDAIDDWLCQCDATDFDAFVQLAIFGEVIYG